MTASYAIIRSGILEYLLRGEISYAELGIYATVHLQANFSSGIWWGSAPRLQAGTRESLRDVQRWLQKLKEIGFLRPFHEHGSRGNYPVLINKYDVRIGALKGKRLNAWKSECWEHPCYEACADHVAEAVAEPVAEAAPIQYPVVSNQEKPSSAAPKTAPSEEAVALASRLKLRILRNIPNLKVSERQDQTWAAEADLMMRRDKRTPEDIREIIDWCQQDPFWQANILSMKKVRKHFDQLTAKRNSERKGGRHAANIDERNLATAGFSN